MDNLKNIRWQQRFENFEKAYNRFYNAIKDVELNPINETMQSWLIQCFEFTFELTWKLLKDYLESEWHEELKSPRQVLKQALQNWYIENGKYWLDALEDRNKTSHIYDEYTIKKIIWKINDFYFPLITELYKFFANEIRK